MFCGGVPYSTCLALYLESKAAILLPMFVRKKERLINENKECEAIDKEWVRVLREAGQSDGGL